MADSNAKAGKDPARETLRDEDDEDVSRVRGGEGVRPLTPHTPILSRDDPVDPKARAKTQRLEALKSEVESARQGEAQSADDGVPETQRIAALGRIEEAAKSLSSGPVSKRKDDASFVERTEVNPILVEPPTQQGRSKSAAVDGRANKGADAAAARATRNEKGSAKKTPPRPRRRAPAPDDEGPATIKVPVMTPSRLKELAEMSEKDAWNALEKTVPAKKKSEAPPKAKDAGTSSSTTSPSTKTTKSGGTESNSGNSKEAAPHSAFAQPTLMASLQDLHPPEALPSAADPRGLTGEDQHTDPERNSGAGSATPPHPESTRIARHQLPSSATEMADGPTVSASGATGEDADWGDPTIAEALQQKSESRAGVDVNAELPRPDLSNQSHRVATVAPVMSLSNLGSVVESGPFAEEDDGGSVEEQPTAGDEIDESLVAAALADDATATEAPDEAEAMPPVTPEGPTLAKKKAPPERGEGALVRGPALDPRANRTQVLGTLDLDPTDDASGLDLLAQDPRTDRLGTPDPGQSVRGRPPPTPHTFHDDDDGLPPPPVADDPAADDDDEKDREAAALRKGAAEAIAKAEANFERDAPPEIPKKIGIYNIEGPIGEGGMAEVFRARHPSRGPVVLKRMRPSLLVEKRYVEMFVREAKIATTLEHENIVSTLDFGAADGAHYLVMEELVGMSLRDLADRVWEAGRSLPLEVVLRSCAQAARGLHHAHETAHLVHRDVSPDNVFVTGEGPTKMLDFGIAKQPDSARLTRTGEIKGKVPFMSPEHILGDPPVSGQSDVWSLAITLYWLLCGTRPFDAATDVMTLQAVVETPHIPPTQRNPALPKAIDALLANALQKRPADRYATALAFAEALDQAARDLVPVDDEKEAESKIDRQVSKTIEEATALPLPNRPARAPYPACVSVFSPPDLAPIADEARAPTEAMVVPKKSSAIWLIAGLLTGALGAFALAALVVAEFLLPKIFGGNP